MMTMNRRTFLKSIAFAAMASSAAAVLGGCSSTALTGAYPIGSYQVSIDTQSINTYWDAQQKRGVMDFTLTIHATRNASLYDTYRSLFNGMVYDNVTSIACELQNGDTILNLPTNGYANVPLQFVIYDQHIYERLINGYYSFIFAITFPGSSKRFAFNFKTKQITPQ